jgi:hypothetical protein
MVSSRKQLAPCPVCGRADQVMKMQTAYNAGEHHFAPPPMPESHASMMKYIGIGMVLVGIGAFLTLVLLAANGFDFLPANVAPVVAIVQAVITIAFIVTALMLSFFAIRHIGEGDEEARRRYPVWDQAMANWNRLRYCTRDKVVFDPRIKKALSDSAVHSQLSLDEIEASNANPAHFQVAVSH